MDDKSFFLQYLFTHYRQKTENDKFVKQWGSVLTVENIINKHPAGSEAQMAWKCIFKPTFWVGNFNPCSRIHRSSFCCVITDQGSLVGLCMQDYKSLCAAATICATLVNIQTNREHFDQLIWIAQPTELIKMSAESWQFITYRNRIWTVFGILIFQATKRSTGWVSV